VNKKTREYIRLCAGHRKVQEDIIRYLASCFGCSQSDSDIWEWLEDSTYPNSIRKKLFGLTKAEATACDNAPYEAAAEKAEAKMDWNAIYNNPEAVVCLVEAVKRNVILTIKEKWSY
jgi:hypothetical protein